MVFAAIGQPHEDESRDELAAPGVLDGEATAVPLVLQFIEIVLAVGAIAVELGQRGKPVRRGDHGHGMLAAQRRHIGFDEGQFVLGVFRASGHSKVPAFARRTLPLSG